MELLGLELGGFAGFSSQFLPLTDKIHVLVGKNNAGKSAILKAIVHVRKGGVPGYGEASAFRCKLIFNDDSINDLPFSAFYINAATDSPAKYHGTYLLSTEGDVQGNSFKSMALVTSDGQTFPLIEPRHQHHARYTYRIQDGKISARGRGEVVGGSALNGCQHLPRMVASSMPETYYISPYRVSEEETPALENHVLPTTGLGLASFLHTLHSNDRERFAAIETTFLSCFPEFDELALPIRGTKVSVELRMQSTKMRVKLKDSGTGVEQMLVMTACILGQDKSSLFLLDEPQDFLHPTLERKFFNIMEDSDHRYIIATHSAAVIDRVQAKQITLVERPGKAFDPHDQRDLGKSDVLSHLGHRNSDLLFYEAAVFVEGPSDKELLPLLLIKANPSLRSQFRDICFCEIGGTRDYQNFKDLEQDVRNHEKLLSSLSRLSLPHLYLFDGDKKQNTDRLAASRPAGCEIDFDFLRRSEVENYLLNEDALVKVISNYQRDAELQEIASESDIRSSLCDLLKVKPGGTSTLSKKLYTTAACGDEPISSIQGSRVLSNLFAKFNLEYDKRRTGLDIVDVLVLDPESQAELAELGSRIAKLPRNLKAE